MTIVLPAPERSRMSAQKCAAAAGSRLRVGSSSNSTGGRFINARANPSRWYIPDENFMTRVSAASNKLVAASNSSVRWSRAVRETLSSAAKKSRFSRADKRGKKDRSVATAKLTWRRTSEAFVCVSASLTTTRPESGSKTVEINFRAVVFPLPFGPRRTKILPVGIVRDTLSRASVFPVRSRPIQLKRAGRCRKIFVTDSRRMLKGDSAKPLYYRVRIAAVGGVHFMPQVISSPRAGPGGGKSVVATEKLEFELLRACCAAALSTNHDERIAELISLGVRWDVLLEQAEFHNVEPFVCAKLLEFRVSLPANLEGDLERRFATNAQRSLRLTRELARIMACLENHSVDAIPYKGPALAQAIYGDVAMRQFSDLDILIRVSDFDRATEAVQELGYEPSTKLRAPVERAWLKTGYERGFDGPQGKNLLELQ